MRSSWCYLLLCADGSYYCGCTTDLDARLHQHQTGAFGGYTSMRRPVQLVWAEEFSDIRDAIDAERRIKGWSRAKKQALIAGDWERLQMLASRSRVVRDALLRSAPHHDEGGGGPD